MKLLTPSRSGPLPTAKKVRRFGSTTEHDLPVRMCPDCEILFVPEEQGAMRVSMAEVGQSYACLINGEMWADTSAGIVNPATEKVFATYSYGTERIVNLAVEAAARAQEEWSQTPLRNKRNLLLSLAHALAAHKDELSEILISETGKPVREATDEVYRSAGLLRYYAEFPSSCANTLFEERTADYVRAYRPLGVAAGIIPWNFPLLIACMKLGPAVVSGNAIILKPAPTTPATTLRFGQIIAPLVAPGLIQVIGDDGSIGPLLSSHTGIDKISFTGSTLTGKRVMASSAGTLKRLGLELGGNDPAIILDDVDVKSVAHRILLAGFGNCGQVCAAAKRLYVHNNIYDDLCQELVNLLKHVVVGPGADPATTIGPLQNISQYHRAVAMLENAKSAGYKMAQKLFDGRPGYFVPPTLLFEIPEDDPIVATEQFAPFLPIQRISCDEEAIHLANSSHYGLTASVWCTDQDRALNVASQIEAGLVCINRHNENPLGVGFSPAKQSGCGWMAAEQGIQEYMQTSLIYL